MPNLEVSAKIGKDGKPVTVNYDLPNDLPGLIKKFGEEVVKAHAKGSIVVALQGFMRLKMQKGEKAAEVQKSVNEWKPNTRTPGKSALEKTRDMLGKLDPELRKQLLAEAAKNR
jgi:hypothetical protein